MLDLSPEICPSTMDCYAQGPNLCRVRAGKSFGVTEKCCVGQDTMKRNLLHEKADSV